MRTRGSHYSRTQSTAALSSGEAELYALSPGTTETMGVFQFLRECEVKMGGYVTMPTETTAEKPMASRLGVSRATKHMQLRCSYFQDLVATEWFDRERATLMTSWRIGIPST